MTVDFKSLPQNIDAEQCVIGSIMLDAGSERVESVLSRLKPEAFYLHQHQVIYREILAMHGKQQNLDLLTLANALDNKGLTESIGGFRLPG